MGTLVIVRQTHAHAERRDRVLRNACAARNLDGMSQILDAYFIDGDAADVGTTLYVLHGGLATLDSRPQDVRSQCNATRAVGSMFASMRASGGHDPRPTRATTAAHASTCTVPSPLASARTLVSRNSFDVAAAVRLRSLASSRATTPLTWAVAMESPDAKS